MCAYMCVCVYTTLGVIFSNSAIRVESHILTLPPSALWLQMCTKVVSNIIFFQFLSWYESAEFSYDIFTHV